MSELEDLRKQVQDLTARVAHFEQHHTAITPPDPGPRPNGALTNRLDAAYQRNKPRMAVGLVSMLAERYRNLSQRNNYASSGIDLAQLPRMLAEELTRVSYIRDELEATKRAGLLSGNPNHAKIARLEVELAALLRHAEDLLSTTTLPEVPEELAIKAGLPRLGHEGRDGGIPMAGGYSR